MITINNERIENIDVVYKTWKKTNTKTYTSKSGTVVCLGYGCELGNGCKLGNGCELGNECELGDFCKLGNGCELGYGCELGNGCKLGNGCELGNFCELGYECEQPYPLWFTGIRFSIGYYSIGMIASGCIIKPVKWWEENIIRCAEENGYTPEQIKEYQWRIKTLVSWMKEHDVYELKGDE